MSIQKKYTSPYTACIQRETLYLLDKGKESLFTASTVFKYQFNTGKVSTVLNEVPVLPVCTWIATCKDRLDLHTLQSLLIPVLRKNKRVQ